MKRRIIFWLVALFGLFSVGIGVCLLYLHQTGSDLRQVILLNEVEDQRQDLDLLLLRAQQDLEVSDTVFANSLDTVIANVRALDEKAAACHSCHHAVDIQTSLDELSALVELYQKKFSVFITAIGGPEMRQALQNDVAEVGHELEDLVRSMRITGTPLLQQHTEQAAERIKTLTWALAATLPITFVVALLAAFTMTRRTTKPIEQLVDAAKQISRGEPGVQVVSDERGEIGRLLEAFNDMSAALATKDELVRERTEEARKTRDIALITLARLAESRDPVTGRHLERIALYSRNLCQALRTECEYRVDDSFCKQLVKSSPLHDIGKIGIPDAVLQKEGPLTAEERNLMRTHTTLGGDILRSVVDEFEQPSFLAMAMEIAYHHHEKWDGSGYPQGLAGKEIPLSARIVALVDAYDAITSDRSYKKALSHAHAVDRILVDRRHHFDPQVVDAFIHSERDIDRIRSAFEDGVFVSNWADAKKIDFGPR